jgi:hypothetical protein
MVGAWELVLVYLGEIDHRCLIRLWPARLQVLVGCPYEY